MHQLITCLQVRRRVRQIDHVTVKGSQQPMGLFTYDVSLEWVPTPAQNQGTYAAYPTPSVNPRESMISQSSLGASLADMGRSQSAPDLADDDIISYSMSAYNWEYSDHPDLACTWAVDEHFLDLWAQVRPRQRMPRCRDACRRCPYDTDGAAIAHCCGRLRKLSMLPCSLLPYRTRPLPPASVLDLVVLSCRASQHTGKAPGSRQSRCLSRPSTCAGRSQDSLCWMAQAIRCSTSWQHMTTQRLSHGRASGSSLKSENLNAGATFDIAAYVRARRTGIEGS